MKTSFYRLAVSAFGTAAGEQFLNDLDAAKTPQDVARAYNRAGVAAEELIEELNQPQHQVMTPAPRGSAPHSRAANSSAARSAAHSPAPRNSAKAPKRKLVESK
jgi:hypothetical protein